MEKQSKNIFIDCDTKNDKLIDEGMNTLIRLLKENKDLRTVIIHDADFKEPVKSNNFVYIHANKENFEDYIKAGLRMAPERVFIMCKSQNLMAYCFAPFMFQYQQAVLFVLNDHSDKPILLKDYVKDVFKIKIHEYIRISTGTKDFDDYFDDSIIL